MTAKTVCKQRLTFLVMVSFWALFLTGVGRARAEEAPPSPKLDQPILSLEKSIRLAVKNNPEIKESQVQIKISQARLAEVKANQFPQIQFMDILGPSPGAKGGDLSFRDSNITASCTQRTPCGIGIFNLADITLIQPLYTFGKITSGKEAAAGGVRVDEARADQKASDIVLKVHEYYYGLLLARDLRALVLDVKEKLDSAKEKVEEFLAEGAKSVDETDLLKLKTFGGVVDRFLNEADKSVELAQHALGMTIGLEKTDAFDVADAHLKPVDRTVFGLDTYIEKAKLFRPEFTQLREGLRARKSLIRVAESDYYPTIFAAGLLSYAISSNRDRLRNPYVIDPLDHITGGVVLGFKWDINFGITAARVQSARAEYEKLLDTKAFADAGIPVQVRKAYLEMVEAKKNIQATGESYTAARQWLVSA
ncbi:MAG TPA: TolC family protein, partial [Nitrospiria bacterium]|nr:TolC family protein [Nitrospiria bacterium]